MSDAMNRLEHVDGEEVPIVIWLDLNLSRTAVRLLLCSPFREGWTRECYSLKIISII